MKIFAQIFSTFDICPKAFGIDATLFNQMCGFKLYLRTINQYKNQTWSRGHKARGQGQTLSRPRPRTKDTDASVLQKKGLQIFFSGEKGLQKFFLGDLYLKKPKKGLCRFSARFLAFSNEISIVQK